MDEKKFVTFRKEELEVKEYVKRELGKGRISHVAIEYTPVGEKIIVSTSKPGLIIGRRGEKIEDLTKVLKRKFKLDNPHLEIKEITAPLFDAQLVADEIALLIERKGALKFKVIAYKMLTDIMKAGAMGVQITLSGKLPSDRARSWNFSQGYLKKTGEPAKVVSRAQAQALTIAGIIGIEVRILPPDAHIHDKITLDAALLGKIRGYSLDLDKPLEIVEKITKKKKKGAA
jgi:small subunit ribosomal protein S3